MSIFFGDLTGRVPKDGLDELSVIRSRLPVIYGELNVFSRLNSFTTKQNLHDFRYEGGAPINSGFQIPVVIEKKEYGLIVTSVTQLLPCVLKLIKCFYQSFSNRS